MKTVYDEQVLNGFDGGDDDSKEVNYLKMFKTIMCPLGEKCPKYRG